MIMIKNLKLVSLLFLLFLNSRIQSSEFTKRPIDWELFQAIEYGMDVGPILKKGADVNALSLAYVNSIYEGDSAWTFALRRARPNIIAELSKYKSDKIKIPDELQVEIFSSAIYTAEKGNPNYSIDRLKMLLSYGLNINSILIEKSKRKWRTSSDGLSPLMIAVTANRAEIVRFMLENGANVNLKNREGKTALNFSKSSEISKLLIGHGASVEEKDENGRTSLHEAILNGKVDVVKSILESMAKPDQVILNEALIITARIKGQTSNKAAHSASAKIAETLIKFGADPNCLPTPGKFRGAPLLEAVYTSNREVTALLLKYKADPLKVKNTNGGSLMALAIQQVDPEIVKMLWPYYQPITKEFEKEIITVSGSYGKAENLKALTDLGFNWKKNSNETLVALLKSVEKSDIENVNLLLSQGIDPNQLIYGNINILVRAVQIGNTDIIKKLIEKGAKINFINLSDLIINSPIRAAVATANFEIFDLLINHGAKLSGIGADEYLIHFLPIYKLSVRSKSEKEITDDLIKIVDILIKHGAKIDIEDNEGRTVLSKLALQGFPELLKKLIDAHANINFIPSKCRDQKSNFEGIEPIKVNGDAGAKVANRIEVNPELVLNQYCQTPIALAALGNNMDNVKIFIEALADINLSSAYNGMTPLMNAAMVGNPDLVSLLLINNANTKNKNKAGQTAIEIAEIRENTRARDLILKYK